MLTFTDGGLVLIPGFLVPIAAVPFAVWILRREADPRWTIMALLALAHVTAVVALTIFPIPIGGQDFYRQTRGMSEDNIVPFATIVDQLQHLGLNTIRQLSGNVLVLMPLGVYGPALWPALRDWRRFVVVAIAFGVGIELTQYAGSLIEGFTYRVTDVDDAIMNATGAIAAFALWPRLARTTFAVDLAARVSESMHAARDPG
jgi:glycopeptide antibiotics resistance protein